jgi:DNA-binding LacI/PurR family transcriptional regulator
VASIKDVAREANVSVSTASRVINKSECVSVETRKKVEEIVKRLNYRPNIIARNLVTKTSNLIGLLVPQIDNPFFTSIIMTVEQYAHMKGYNVLLCFTNEDIAIEKEFLYILETQRVAGIIVTPVGTEHKHFTHIIKTIPTVFIGRHFEKLNASFVDINNEMGSYNAIEHLYRLGHRNIAVINNPFNISTARSRWKGAKKALRHFGLIVRKEHIIEANYTIQDAYEKVGKILKDGRKFTAIYACHNMPALGALRAIMEKRLKIPEDISLVAFNGNDDSVYNYMFRPTLSANMHPTRKMAETAVDMIYKMIQSVNKNKRPPECYRKIVYDLNFVPRESSCAIK